MIWGTMQETLRLPDDLQLPAASCLRSPNADGRLRVHKPDPTDRRRKSSPTRASEEAHLPSTGIGLEAFGVPHFRIVWRQDKHSRARNDSEPCCPTIAPVAAGGELPLLASIILLVLAAGKNEKGIPDGTFRAARGVVQDGSSGNSRR